MLARIIIAKKYTFEHCSFNLKNKKVRLFKIVLKTLLRMKKKRKKK